ncbi:MAG: indole-3-glycerol phosphate synthase TrpC [Chitinivibrionales bacterium]|nr:indole-3-glycerol phosphate synthase TrpC [Chitinivibrionales bacterium]MBD3394914.1 indole-3-glycerol phosphate synthase TrpC [Chitinivibrionales bacterium]
MADFLKTILDHKREEVRALYAEKGRFAGGRSDSRRAFVQALTRHDDLGLIAEVKKASPSRGLIRDDFNPVEIASAYARGGADAVSVLTDARFFQGTIKYLEQVRGAVALPVLRKEFIIDPIQVAQTAAVNADALLLIAAALSDGQMNELYCASVELDIEPLIEVHDIREFERVMRISPTVIGINNRNLETFDVSLDATLAILPHVPESVTVVSESGIFNAADARCLRTAGVHAILVGESLMRSGDPGALITELKEV